MKKYCLILIQFISALILVASSAYAAPYIGGVMRISEWAGYYTDGDGVVSPGGGGQDFDIEKIGLFMDDTKLYIGLQTGFDITGDNKVDTIEGGDFALDFGDDGSFEFGFRYDISSSGTINSVKLYHANSWDDPSPHSSSTPWRMNAIDGNALASTSNGSINAAFGKSTGWWGWPYGDTHYTLEASVNLSVLTDKLKAINTNGYHFDRVTAHWTMGCGNDVLETTMTKNFDYNPVPEPATLLLFGMGLLGAGALGRKKIRESKAEKSEA